MLIAPKLHYLLAVQFNLLHMLIPEKPDCKTVHCNISCKAYLVIAIIHQKLVSSGFLLFLV